MSEIKEIGGTPTNEMVDVVVQINGQFFDKFSVEKNYPYLEQMVRSMWSFKQYFENHEWMDKCKIVVIPNKLVNVVTKSPSAAPGQRIQSKENPPREGHVRAIHYSRYRYLVDFDDGTVGFLDEYQVA